MKKVLCDICQAELKVHYENVDNNGKFRIKPVSTVIFNYGTEKEVRDYCADCTQKMLRGEE